MTTVQHGSGDEGTRDKTVRDHAQIEELPSDDSDDDFEDIAEDPGVNGAHSRGKASSQQDAVHVDLPPWLKPETFSLSHDDLTTTTSEARNEVTSACVPLLSGERSLGLPLNSYGIPHLNKDKHISFLRNSLAPLPAFYVAIDASRPWFFYWAMAGLSFLGQDVTAYKERLIETIRPLQNPTGGFGGGHGQNSHCAGTYATILALAAVGGLDVVDRHAMWHFLGAVKEADGGFRMAVGAEEDIRGAYCAMTVITLLNLPLDLPPSCPARQAGLEKFTDRLGDWIGKCQTYEGGIAGAPTNEAHGAYAFCALACLSLLDAPHISIPRHLHLNALIRWIAGIQTAPEGGFAGRTNKLVDACYSHWVGGCGALLQAAIHGTPPTSNGPSPPSPSPPDLWNREGLIRYLLCCGQHAGKKGGMRDKPSARPDAYHTCYSLAGLSAAMNHYWYEAEAPTQDEKTGRLIAAFNWNAERASAAEMKAWKFDHEDAVLPVHPVFVLPFDVVEKTKEQFQGLGFVGR